MRDRKSLATIVDTLRTGDLSYLSDLVVAAQADPQSVASALRASKIHIDGDGNIVGDNNVVLVDKSEVPSELVAPLERLAVLLPELTVELQQVRQERQAVARDKQAAELYDQAKEYLHRGRLRKARTVLAELRAIMPLYWGIAALQKEITRALAVVRSIQLVGGFIVLALAVWSIWNALRPACPGNVILRWPGTQIRAVAFQKDGDIVYWWVGRSNSEASLMISRGTPQSRQFYSSDVVGGETVLSLAVDLLNQRVWAGTVGGLSVLCRPDDQSSVCAQGTQPTWHKIPHANLPGCKVNALLSNDRGQVYVGAEDPESSDKGLSVYDGEDWSSLPAPKELHDPQQVFRVYSLANDNGIIWAGSHYGLYRLEGKGWSSRYQPQEVTNFIVQVIVINDGLKWVGTRDGLYVLNDRSGEAQWLGPISTGLTNGAKEIRAAVFLPKAHKILVGTDQGLSACELKSISITTIKASDILCEAILDQDLNTKPIYSLAVGPDEKEVLVGIEGSDPIMLLIDEIS